MRVILALVILVLFQKNLPEKLFVDVSKTDQINASEIVDNIITVPLKDIDIKNIGAEKVFLINDYIFILQRFKEKEIYSSHVIMFDIKGNYKGKLETRDLSSKEQLNIIDMLYDDINNSILRVYSNGYGKFDSSGKLLSYNKYNWKEKGSNILTPFMFIFKGQIWFEEISKNNDAVSLKLIHANLNFQGKEIIKTLKSYPSTFTGVFPNLSLSSNKNELFVSFTTDNIIYKVDKGLLTPVFELEIKGGSKSVPDVMSKQELIGKYIKDGYWSSGIEYDFLYNTENRKSYNIKYNRNSDGVYISGITDDYYNTGYFKFNPTNRADYIYFIKNFNVININFASFTR